MKKVISSARWILALPLAIIIGSFINLVTVEVIIGFLKLTMLTSFLELFLFPFIIGIISILIGSKIAPKFSIKTAIILFVVSFILEIIIVLTSPLVEGSTPLIKASLSIVGCLAGLALIWREQRGKMHSTPDVFADNLQRNIMLDHIEFVEKGIRPPDDDYRYCLSIKEHLETLEKYKKWKYAKKRDSIAYSD